MYFLRQHKAPNAISDPELEILAGSADPWSGFPSPRRPRSCERNKISERRRVWLWIRAEKRQYLEAVNRMKKTRKMICGIDKRQAWQAMLI